MRDIEGGAPADPANAQLTRRDVVIAAAVMLGIASASLAGSPCQPTAASLQ